MVEDFQEESNTKAKIILIEQKYKSDRFTDNIIGKMKNISDDNNVNWISYYARQGFVEFYRKRISEMEMIQKETFKQ